MPKSSVKKDKFVAAVGRRKGSVARVRLFKGTSENLVNGQVIGLYFPGDVAKTQWSKPFDLTQTTGKYYITAKVAGGGKQGQLTAVVQGTAAALALSNVEKYRSIVKKAGLLTRDNRVRERRKVGTGGKARRAKQSPKR